MVQRGPCGYGLKHQKEKRSMDHFAGLDVSVKETSVCIVDETGRIVREVKVASEPEALLAVLKNPAYRFTRIGLEAGPLSQWLFSALAEAGLPVICVETRHMRAVLKAQINKTDRNDARGMAQMMRVGLYRPVHVKTLRSQKLRMLLTHRKLLQSKAIAVDNDLRSTLRNFGLKVGMVGAVKFEARIMSWSRAFPTWRSWSNRCSLSGECSASRSAFSSPAAGHRPGRWGLPAADDGPRCRPRGGADLPRHHRCAGALSDLQVGRGGGWTDAGEVSIGRTGAISRCGDEIMRMMLYEAAQSRLVHSTKWSWLKAWAMKIARHRGMKKAIVALAHRLAVIMHRIWVDGTEFRWTREVVTA